MPPHVLYPLLPPGVQAQRPRGSGEATPVAVSAWGKAAPPKDNGKAGYGQSVAGGAWERDA